LTRTSETRGRLAIGWAVKRAREQLEALWAWVAGGFGASSAGDGVLPPRRLRARTGAPGAEEFVLGGRDAAHQLVAGLESAGEGAQTVRAVLDFGCGSGRVLPHVAALAREARCFGCDVDRGAIAWCARHRPELSWAVSGSEPGLPFEAESFDLVYSISVFSHLDEALQDRWLEELRRILVPGGVALLSVHGASALDDFRSGRASTSWCRSGAFARGPLGGGEFVFEAYVRSVWNRSDLPGVGSRYGLTFHGGEYLRHHWSDWLEVVAVRERAISGWQDLVVCRRIG
jgi:SAM-dependent methyltransferase